MRVLAIIAASAALSACATIEATSPVTGQFGTVAAAGQATARSDGNGTFWVQIPGGMRCEGRYDSTNVQSSLVVPVTCDNGRSGEVVITRQLDLRSGTAIVSLNDGTKGQFVFGNLKFDQAFGAGGTARTAPIAR